MPPPPVRPVLQRRPTWQSSKYLALARRSREDPLRAQTRELLQDLNVAEVGYLRTAACPVLATKNRICRAVVTRARARGWRTPAPLVARLFQELSEGMEAYNTCIKTKEIPMPFAYVQFNALLLLLFNLLAPIAIGCFTSTSWPASFVAVAFSVITAMIVSAGEGGRATACVRARMHCTWSPPLLDSRP